MKKPRLLGRTALTILAAVFALAFVLPTLLTITNSFMTQSEITANSLTRSAFPSTSRCCSAARIIC